MSELGGSVRREGSVWGIRKAFLSVARYHWILLIIAAPFLVFPSSLRSIALIVIPVIWFSYLFTGNKDNFYQSSTFDRQPSTISGFPSTPLNISILALSIMLLVSLWATFSIELSLEKIAGLVLGLGVYFAVVYESRKNSGFWWCLAIFLAGGLAWSALGLIGMEYQVRFSFLEPIITRVPVLIHSFPTLGTGLHHNAVGGTLVWVLPLMASLSWFSIKEKDRVPRKYRSLRGILWLGTLFMGLVLFLTQSRGSYLAFFIFIFFLLMILLPVRGRWILAVLLIVCVVIGGMIISLGGGWVQVIGGTQVSEDAGFSINTLEDRIEIWSRAILGISDFPLTGMGMNTFRETVHILYPMFTIPPEVDLGHAHNEFLQAALDLGIPGMVAFISIYVIAFWMLARIWRMVRMGKDDGHQSGLLGDPVFCQFLVLGLGGGLFAHLVFGLMDAITLGAKPGIFFWMLLGLISILYYLTNADVKEVDQ